MAEIKKPLSIRIASYEEIKSLDRALTDDNIKAVKELPRAEITRLDFAIEDTTSKLLGGIQAYQVNWGILHIELLYVYENYRHQGIGSLLLKHVEKIAKAHNCYLAQLDTFDFQAKTFYLEHGYQIFGVLENAPKGHNRYYMRKDL